MPFTVSPSSYKGGDYLYGGISNFGSSLASGIQDWQKRQQSVNQFEGQLELMRGMTTTNEKGEQVPILDDKTYERYKAISGQQKAALGGELFGALRLGHALAQDSKVAVTIPGTNQVARVPAETAYTAALREPERKAHEEYLRTHTESVKTSTDIAKQKAEAQAAEPTVMMEIAPNTYGRVKLSEVVKHPSFLEKDSTAKDLNNQVFAATGLSLPQVAQGWNKRVVNGQLVFDAPVMQQQVDPITQRPVPKYNANGTPAYEQVPDPAHKGQTLTRTQTYQLPQEHTPDVLRIIGTEGVSGAEQVKVPSGETKGPKIVPGSVQSGTPVRISSDEDFAALPSGATFIGPDGKVRRKP